jgi:hypothetical protein
MQGQSNESAVGSEAVGSGVTNDERFETLSADLNGYGHACSGQSCGHPAHGLSTAGENFVMKEYAADRYDGQSMTVEGMRFASDIAYDPEIAQGGDTAISALRHDSDTCDIERCLRCNDVSDRLLQRESKVDVHGGGGTGKAKDIGSGRSACGCGLYSCEHRAGMKKHAGGRRAKGPRSRTKPHSVKVSEEAKVGLKQPGATELIDELGFAIMNGLTIAEARKRLGIDVPEAA